MIAHLAVLEGTDILGDSTSLRMLWHDPDDLAQLKEACRNKFLVMGRNTYDAISKKWLTEAAARDIWVVTRDWAQNNYKANGRALAWFGPMHAVESALHNAELHGESVLLLGGLQVYRQLIPHCTSVEIAVISRSKLKPSMSRYVGADTNLLLRAANKELARAAMRLPVGRHTWTPTKSPPRPTTSA